MMRKLLVLFCLICLFAISAGWASPQKQQKTNPAAATPSFMSVSDEIDHDIGEMLGAWQVGDVEAMHKYYAEDATWVSGSYDVPVAGWQNYVQTYLQQRKDLSGVQLIRKNTNVFHYGDTAWACYQWEFDGLVQGKPITAHGQTTLVFVKQGNRWLIVHNHTSQICPGS
ncbi:MAG: nuclear transport factor 2 family protein [Candidatus Acidiferrales bacterium]